MIRDLVNAALVQGGRIAELAPVYAESHEYVFAAGFFFDEWHIANDPIGHDKAREARSEVDTLRHGGLGELFRVGSVRWKTAGALDDKFRRCFIPRLDGRAKHHPLIICARQQLDPVAFMALGADDYIEGTILAQRKFRKIVVGKAPRIGHPGGGAVNLGDDHATVAKVSAQSIGVSAVEKDCPIIEIRAVAA